MFRYLCCHIKEKAAVSTPCLTENTILRYSNGGQAAKNRSIKLTNQTSPRVVVTPSESYI